MRTERQALLKTRWDDLIDGRGGSADASGSEVFRDLIARYSEPHRHYHNVEHIAWCLEICDRLPAEFRTPELELAIWFHDAIYDPRRNDNEAASAELAGVALGSLDFPRDFRATVERLILATDHRDSASARADERTIVDIDLSILGAPEADYKGYATAIRKEYGHVPDAAYRRGRAAVLRHFLDRKSIYHSEDFQRRYEASARANLAGELASLGS